MSTLDESIVQVLTVGGNNISGTAKVQPLTITGGPPWLKQQVTEEAPKEEKKGIDPAVRDALEQIAKGKTYDEWAKETDASPEVKDEVMKRIEAEGEVPEEEPEGDEAEQHAGPSHDKDHITKAIIFHPEGAQNKSTPRVLKYSTIQYILEKYKKFDICHVGGKDDDSIGHGVHDCRGMDLWEVVELTSKAAIFIGVDSGPYHIAQAYPRINRKLIITEDQFKTDWPRDSYILDPKRDVTYWYDWDTMFFNEFGIDVGITTSYLKI